VHFNTCFNTSALHRFWAPTRLFQGLGCRSLVREILAREKPTVLLVDAQFQEHPFLSELSEWFGGWVGEIIVKGEPSITLADAAIAKIEGRTWNQLLALGGGSTLDLAKALLAHRTFGNFHRVGYGAMSEVPDLWPVETGCPFLAIPTTAGTGSETSRYFLLSDPHTKHKVVSRAWTLCPSVALLDPFFLKTMPEPLMIMGAFDAFTHLWETNFCAQESSLPVRALCKEGIILILARMMDLEREYHLGTAAIQELQVASAWGGIALSNVRTGLLHTSGEALAAQLDLPHPLTLWTFYRAGMVLFRDAYMRNAGSLLTALAAVLGGDKTESLDRLQELWSRAFQRIGAELRLRTAFRAQPPEAGPLIDTVLTDRVLLTKEAPKALDEASIRVFVQEGLQHWL
jgi:alcohol dehydrogenase class IV